MCTRNIVLGVFFALCLAISTIEVYDNFCPERQYALVFKIIEWICAFLTVVCALWIVMWYKRPRKKLINV